MRGTFMIVLPICFLLPEHLWAKKGIAQLVSQMERVIDLDELDGDTWIEDPQLGLSIQRTFPNNTINCFTFTRDASLFSERMFVLFQESNVIPPIAIDDQNNRLGCRGFFVFADDVATFKGVLAKLPRWSTHRMYCLIHRTDAQEMSKMLQDEIQLFGDAEVALFIYGNWNTGFQLGQPIRQFEMIGNFSHQDNYTWEVNLDGYRDFFGREVRFSTTNCSIFSTVDDNGNIDNFRGIDWMVFVEMSRRMNLSLKYVKPMPGAFMGKLINGSWEGGIIGAVFHNQADIAFCGNWIESSKINTGIEISVPVQRMCINYLVPRPRRAIGKWYVVFSPFSRSLWILLGVTILLVGAILNVLSLKMKFFHHYRAKFYESRGNALLAVYGILVQGSWPSSKWQQGPIRHISTGWVVFGLLMTTSFSSTLVSHLAKPKFNKKPEGIKDLLDMGYTWTESSPFPVERLLNMEDPFNQRWADQIKLVGSTEEKLQDLRLDNRVIIGVDFWGGFTPLGSRPIPDDIVRRYETMDGCIADLYEGFIFRSGSPFNEDFNFYVRQLRECGLVGRHAQVALHMQTSRSPAFGWVKTSVATMPANEKALSLVHLSGIFKALILGHLVALIALISELAVAARDRSKQADIEDSAPRLNSSTSTLESHLFQFTS